MGLNLVGLRRHDVSHQAIDGLKRAFHTLYLAGHTNPVAAALIEQQAAEGGEAEPLLHELARFVGSSHRGLVPHAATSARQKLRR
jgi:acyl-[acyl carrier protein]--UDP-N-acetylglucosamine O-acyltransferase